MLLQVFISILIIVLATKIILTGKIIDLHDLFIVLAITLIGYILIVIKPELEPMVGAISFLVVTIYFWRKKYPIKLILVSIVATFIMLVLADQIGSLIVYAVVGVVLDVSEVRTDPYIYAFLLVFIYSTTISTAFALHWLINKLKDNMRLINGKTIIAALSTFSFIAVFFYWIAFSVNTNDFMQLSVLVVLMLVALAASILSVYYVVKSNYDQVLLNARTNELNNLNTYTAEIEKLNSNLRKFKHDYINILSTMSLYIDNHQHEELKHYFYTKIMPLSHQFTSDDRRLGDLANIMQLELKSILASKLLYAQGLDIAILVDVPQPISLAIDMIDLCRIVAILLDNAIEAAVKSNNPKVSIGLFQNNTTQTIIIANTYDDRIPIAKFREKGFSTKGQGRGIGLANLREVISKYDNVVNDTLYEADELRQIVEIGGIKEVTGD